ncbi:MAG: hypothetical protein ACRDRG_00180 [Pseudonocardiaceae bacterium]
MTTSEFCRTELQAIAAELSASLAKSLSPDQQAYAALAKDGELHPWTEQAEAIWTRASGSDPWRDHHLAILHHAKAYDLETAGRREAFQHWTAALRHWSAVHADDAFWARMAEHLSERMGAEIAPGVIAGVRARLPRELLEPHRDLIAAYQASDPERARSHMSVLTSAPFDPDVIDRIRRQFTEEVLAAVPEAVMTADFERMIARLRRWQHIDQDNAHLLRSLLYVYRMFNEQLWDSDDGFARVSDNVAAVGQILTALGVSPPDPAGVAGYVDRLRALRPGGLPPEALSTEIARHEVWGGLVNYQLVSRRFSWESDPESRRECERAAATAVKHFAVARQLDPHVTLDSYYSALPSIEASVESLWGLCLVARRDYGGAAQHCRRATTLDPSDAESFFGLAQTLLIPENPTNAALVEAERAISRASTLARESGKMNAADVDKLQRLLQIRRTTNRGR